MVKFEIQLDNSSAVFYPNEIITGNVVFELYSDIRCKGIFLHFVGKAIVEFTDRNGGKVSAENVYFNENITLWGTAGQKELLNSGSHSLPISFTLPQNLPSSFQGKYGSVQYLCSAKLARHLKSDKEHEVPFTVIPIVDLNIDTTASYGITVTGSMASTCPGANPAEDITARVSLEKQGYVPGEPIFINANVQNSCGSGIAKTVAHLQMICGFKAGGQQLCNVKTIASTARGWIPPYGGAVWNNVLLHIPPCPPSKLGCCEIITVDYEVQFEVTPEEPKDEKPLVITLPIIVGTIPLRSNFHMFSDANPSVQSNPGISRTRMRSVASFGSFGAISPPPTSAIFSLYPDLPPPSYEECVQTHEDEQPNDVTAVANQDEAAVEKLRTSQSCVSLHYYSVHPMEDNSSTVSSTVNN